MNPKRSRTNSSSDNREYDSASSSSSCELKHCSCSPPQEFARRDFIKLSGLGVAGLGMRPMAAMAGPFAESDYAEGPIPLNKKLRPEWIQSLYERGTPTTYRGWEELRFIGMPVGGIGCGTVYIGGDGKLWCWDIFNEHHEGAVPNHIEDPRMPNPSGRILRERDGSNYVFPTSEQHSPWTFEQGFLLRVDDRSWPMDRLGFSEISFCGQYPIARIDYSDASCPLNIELEAFTPFIPLDVDRSSFPATILRYKLKNDSDRTVTASLTGFMQNPTLRGYRGTSEIERVLRFHNDGFSGHAEKAPIHNTDFAPREDIQFEDFESQDWGEWTAIGDAFEGGPFPADLTRATGQNSSGYSGEKLVNTYNTRLPGNADDFQGTLTSSAFKIQRKYVTVAIAGGNRPRDCYLEVVVDGKSVGQVTGHGNNVLKRKSINVSRHEGKDAQIRIVDRAGGSWAQVAIDRIVFSDVAVEEESDLESRGDFGSISLRVLNASKTKVGMWDLKDEVVSEETPQNFRLRSSFDQEQVAAVEETVELPPGETREVAFVVAWHFPNTHINGRKRWYASRFPDAKAVADAVLRQCDELTRQTRLWRDTWYSGSLPHWFLERTLLTVDTLQTNTCYRFDDGEFWAWEGIGCCPGTCTHVWHYAQAVGRLFPTLERDLRERTDFGRAFRADNGMIDFRGGQAGRDATDGQAGVILRTYREHLMSGNTEFLKRVWPKCKQALEFLVTQDARDGDPDGMPVGEQHNTLDAEWFGKVPVLASLYLSALKAGETMAGVLGDSKAAKRFRGIHEKGRVNILSIYRKDYGFFVQEEDPGHLNAIGIGEGCYIDQVMGQWWAWNLGLGRLYDAEAIRSSLNKLWDYNYCPDMGSLRESIKNPSSRGRPYAISGDAGLVMCTWPQGGKRENWEEFWQYGYFNECMSGFEYQAAGHMIWESQWEPALLEKGLAITRSIHDRYHASMRNPFNEIECSDHYARAMASYGVFLAACGFEYDGPAGYIGFSPRLNPEKFSSAFTSAEGWGTIGQERTNDSQTSYIEPVWGTLRCQQIALSVADDSRVSKCEVFVDGVSIAATHSVDSNRLEVQLDETLMLDAGSRIEIRIS